MNKLMTSRKTKIVATIGPASWSADQLEKCLLAGVNVARLNFSHGNIEQHQETINKLRIISVELGASVAILQDLQGPKIRLALFEGEKELNKGDKVVVTGPGGDTAAELVVDFPEIHRYLNESQSVFIDDGIIELQIQKIDGEKVHCEVIHGGTVRPRKGVNLPGAQLPIESMTEKDIKDLEAGASMGFDYVALSFVRKSEDIIKLKEKLKAYGSKARVVAKIEKLEAIEDIENIVDASDAIMIARGDLAVEIGQVHLPAVQKRITRICNHKGKPVITATQMLDSMQVNSRPTRAEITDVANAVLDGSDALMLSGETAFGDYPVESVETMSQIVKEVEKQNAIYYRFKNRKEEKATVPESIAISAVLCAKQLKAKAIVCMSTTGRTAQAISKFRPKAKLIACTALEDALCRLELCWGVQTLRVDNFVNTEEAIEKVEKLLVSQKIVEEGDKVVLTLGLPVIKGQKTNALRVFRVGQQD